MHCTGIVSLECFERYQLPESLIIHSSSSFVLRSPNGRGAHIRRKSVQAHVLDRVQLDQLLVARAQDAGAQFMTSVTVNDIRWDGQQVQVGGYVDGKLLSMNARVAVLATGYGSRLSRSVGLGANSEAISGCQAVVEVEGLSELEVFTGDGFGDGGFGWLVPWKPGLALAGLLTRRQSMDYLRQHLDRLQEVGRIGAVHEMFRCRGVPLGVPERAVLDGIIGVGDVVGQVKPTSGGGIYYGLLGADAAAKTLLEALAANDLSAQGLAAYERRWRDTLEPEIRQGYTLRRLIEQMPEVVIENLHRLLGVPVLRRMLLAAAPSFDWHSRPLTHVLKRLSRHGDKREAVAP